MSADEPKDALNSILDKVDDAMDKLSILRQIGTPEEEEEATRKREPSLYEWKYVPSAQKWHSFFLDRPGKGDIARCGLPFNDTVEIRDPKKLPARSGIVCCTLCVLRSTR